MSTYIFLLKSLIYDKFCTRFDDLIQVSITRERDVYKLKLFFNPT